MVFVRLQNLVSYGLAGAILLNSGCSTVAPALESTLAKREVPPILGPKESPAVIVQAVHEQPAASDTEGLLPPPAEKSTTANVVTKETSAAPPENADNSPTTHVLNLGNVLYLADAQNPNVGVARERILEAYARVDRADFLWLPSIRAGLNYNHHDGNLQDGPGSIIDIRRSAFYGGFGANAVGASSPGVPGLVAQFHLTDAIFQPKIVGHQAASRQFGATAVRNDVLRNTAIAYLELMRAEQAAVIAEEARTNTQALADLTGEYARTGQGLRSDHERMLADLAQRKAAVITAIETAKVNSARLAQLLHLDSSVRLGSGEPAVVPLDLITEEQRLADCVATALSRRPELAEQQHLVCEAVQRLKREQFAPLLPSVLLSTSYGGMSGGVGNRLVNGGDRWDADAIAFWEIRNLGVGERAARNETASVARQAHLRELAVMDQVARDVIESQSQVTQRLQRIEAVREGIPAAERSYALNLERIKNAQGLPIEALQAIQALQAARQSYLDAVIDYNVSQFELCRAMGWFTDT